MAILSTRITHSFICFKRLIFGTATKGRGSREDSDMFTYDILLFGLELL